jgi:hypothetical protein
MILYEARNKNNPFQPSSIEDDRPDFVLDLLTVRKVSATSSVRSKHKNSYCLYYFGMFVTRLPQTKHL